MTEISIDSIKHKRDAELYGSNYSQNESETILDSGRWIKYLNSKPYLKDNPQLIPLIFKEIETNQRFVKQANEQPNELMKQLDANRWIEVLLNKVTSTLKSRETQQVPIQPDIHSSRDLLDPIPISYTTKDTGAHTPASVPILNQPQSQMAQEQSGNILPDIDTVHYIEYNMSMDMCNTGDQSRLNKFTVKFDKVSGISKICLKSFIVERNNQLEYEPYIYIKLGEFKGKCYISGTTESFGKLIVNKIDNRFIHYVPDTGTCIQIFKTPISLDTLTISFLNKQGKSINLKEIQLSEIDQENDVFSIYTKYNTTHLKTYNEYTLDIMSDTFMECSGLSPSEIKDNTIVFEGLQDIDITKSAKIKLYNDNIEASCVFTFSEINWPLIKTPTQEDKILINLNTLLK